jgi:hypothetical protein
MIPQETENKKCGQIHLYFAYSS